jgi:2'-5' RNA ligase
MMAAMPFAIELALDADSGRMVRSLWRRLADAGIRFMADSRADPHVSVAIWEELDVAEAAVAVASLAAATAPLALSFPEVRTFGDEVVYLAVAASAGLCDLQARVHAGVGRHGGGLWAHYAPASWLPHCTLAMDLGPGQLAAALPVARALPLPLNGHLDRIAIVEFRPIRERFSQVLTGR